MGGDVDVMYGGRDSVDVIGVMVVIVVVVAVMVEVVVVTTS